MLAPTRPTHFSWSLKLGTFITANVLVALDAIFRGDYRSNNYY